MSSKQLSRFALSFNELPASTRAAVCETLGTAVGRTDLVAKVIKRPVATGVLWSIFLLLAVAQTLNVVFRADLAVVPLLVALLCVALGAVAVHQTWKRVRAAIPEGFFMTARDIVIQKRGTLYVIPRSVVSRVDVTRVYQRAGSGDGFLSVRIAVHTADGRLYSETTGDREAIEIPARSERAHQRLDAAMRAGDRQTIVELDPFYEARLDPTQAHSGWRTSPQQSEGHTLCRALPWVRWELALLGFVAVLLAAPLQWSSGEDRPSVAIGGLDIEDTEELPQRLYDESLQTGHFGRLAHYALAHPSDARGQRVAALLDTRLAAYGPAVRPLLIRAAQSVSAMQVPRVTIAMTPVTQAEITELEQRLAAVTEEDIRVRSSFERLGDSFDSALAPLLATLASTDPEVTFGAAYADLSGLGISIQMSFAPADQPYADDSGRSMLTPVDIVFTIASNDNATVTSTLRVPAPERPSGLEAQWDEAMAQLADHLRGLILATES